MRLAPLLALLGSGLALLAAPALHAQADPNPPEAYYPLHVGDLWEYRPEFPTSPSSSNYPFERRAILGERFVAGTRYAIERTQRFRFDGSTWIQQERRVLVRFDAATASVVIRDGDTERDRFGCRLDLPFPGGACSGAGPYALYQGAAVATVQIGSTAVTTSVRRFDGAVPGRHSPPASETSGEAAKGPAPASSWNSLGSPTSRGEHGSRRCRMILTRRHQRTKYRSRSATNGSITTPRTGPTDRGRSTRAVAFCESRRSVRCPSPSTRRAR